MKDTNEIELRRRTLENNTYESIEDKKLKKITSWRKSQQKFFKNLIYKQNYIIKFLLALIQTFYYLEINLLYLLKANLIL